MKQILSALIELSASQAATLQSLDERLSAFEKMSLYYHAEREDDLCNRLGDERRAHRESAEQLRKQFEGLRELVASLAE